MQVTVVRMCDTLVHSVPHDGDWLGQGVNNRCQRPSLSVPRRENGCQPMTEPSIIIVHYLYTFKRVKLSVSVILTSHVLFNNHVGETSKSQEKCLTFLIAVGV